MLALEWLPAPATVPPEGTVLCLPTVLEPSTTGHGHHWSDPFLFFGHPDMFLTEQIWLGIVAESPPSLCTNAMRVVSSRDPLQEHVQVRKDGFGHASSSTDGGGSSTTSVPPIRSSAFAPVFAGPASVTSYWPLAH